MVEATCIEMCLLVRRASPDGQSIRLRGDEIPTEYRRKRDRGLHSRGEDSDDDYVNVREISTLAAGS